MCTSIILSCFIGMYEPPKEFDYEPTVPYVVEYLPQEELREACWLPHDVWVWGCVPATYYIKVLILEDLKKHPAEHDIILRHEKAHINGWRH